MALVQAEARHPRTPCIRSARASADRGLHAASFATASRCVVLSTPVPPVMQTRSESHVRVRRRCVASLSCVVLLSEVSKMRHGSICSMALRPMLHGIMAHFHRAHFHPPRRTTHGPARWRPRCHGLRGSPGVTAPIFRSPPSRPPPPPSSFQTTQ